MKLRDARLCAQCEEIYEGTTECPSCTSRAFIQICKFVPTAADFERWARQLDKAVEDMIPASEGDRDLSAPHKGVQATAPSGVLRGHVGRAA